MAAIIRSRRNGILPVIGASRDDLVVGDVVTVNSVDTATTYSWSIAYKPPGSAAVFSGSPANASPGSFTVDEEGPYLVRLVVDLGLPTEDEQFVRLRYLTVFGDLRLVAAGEQYGPISIPVDAPFTGWADEQNYNLRTILGFVAKVSASGRLLYVDANASTEGYGDYATIQAALNFAAATATATTPWVVAVRPGTYTEDLTLRPNVHVVAWPGSGSAFGNTNPVLVRGVHTLNLPNAADVTVVGGMCLSVHLATTSPGLTKTGPGNLIVSDCRVGVDVSTPTQGPALRLDAGPMSVYGSSVVVAPANPITTVGLYQAGGTVLVHDTDVQAPTGIFVPPTAPVGTTTTVRYSRVTATGGAGATSLRTDATSTTVQYSVLTAGVSPAVSVHPGGGAYAGAMTLDVQWSRVSGTVAFDTTGIVGASTLLTGAVTHGGLVFPGGSPTLIATVRSDSVFYDNTASGLTSADAQGAIDELVALLAPFTAGYTLGQAYNGGGPGAGRTIVADSGSVRILDGAFPSDPVPAGNTNGNIEVVGKVSVGALTKPEIDVDPNPYGTGPRISMGWTVVPNNSPTGVGMATVVGRSTEAPLYRNYDLRLGTMPASGGGKVGDVVVRAGDGTQGGATTPNPGSVYVLAGSGLDGTANRGNVILSPGVDAGGNPGAVVLVDPRTATPASVTAAGVCSSPVGVTGTITFATDLGAATASINAVDTLAVVVAKLDALLGLSASSAAGIITVSSRTTGLSARVYFLSASAGLDAALGTFDGQSMTAGTYPDYIAIQTTASNEVTFGANGATGPLVYNADTGKLTVPGLIDPTGMVFEEAPAPGTGATQGAVFVSDGTGGLTLGDLYYQGPGSAIPVTLAGGAGGSPTVTYVYRPGGVAAANVYTDFNLLYTAMSAVQGPKAILFDNTGLPPLAPVNIPPKSGGGFYSFRNVSAYGIQLAPGSTSFPGPIVRFHNDGVNQAQCDSFFDYSRCIAWVSNTLAGLPAVVLNDVNKHVVIADNCAFTATGAAEFFQVDGGGGFPVTFLDIILRRTSVVGAASRSFRAINAGSINVSAFDSPVGSDTLATDATSYISVAYDALTLPQVTQPGCAAGTYDFTARAEHLGNQVRLRDVLPGSNTITLGVTGPNEITIGDGAANPMVYDAVTGKLTVPGVIDPTALILSDPAAGTDLYLESADGQTAAVAPAGRGRIRYNNTSAQWEQATNGGAYTPVASTTTYVYRPGGTASGNVYTDFNLLYTAMSAVQGPKAILFDDTGLPLLTPVDIPPKSGGGFYSFRGVSAYGIQRRSGGASALVTVRFHNDGVNQAQCDSFFDYSRYVGWVSNTLAGFPAVALSDTSTHYVTLESSTVTAVAGTASFFYVDGGGGVPSTALIAMLVDVNVVNGTAAVFQAINSGFIALNGFRTSNVFADTLASDASSSFEVYVDANSTVSETQTSLTIGTWSTNWLDSGMAGGLTLTTPGPGGDSISVAVTGPNQITIGSGAANPMIYDAVTGKLTVPGVIDPTALILEAAATPATGATEGAIFVSDGTGGLASGSFYLRPPSNGTPLDLTGTVASGTDFYANVWPVWKKPCRVATTANVTSFAGSAPLTVDGVNVTTGDRVLVTVQTAGAGNGIYRVTVPGTGSDGTWVRDDDFNASSEVIAGLLVYVQEGSQNSRTRFTLVTTGTINLGVTTLEFIQEAPLVRTDATSSPIIAAGTAFTAGTFVWSSAVDMRDYSEISVWFGSTNIGSNTQVDLYVQWSDDGSTIPFDDDNGIQQTDFLIATGSTGVFQPKNYVARLTTAGGELVANAVKMLSFPKKGGSFRFGVVGNNASGTFGVRAQRLA